MMSLRRKINEVMNDVYLFMNLFDKLCLSYLFMFKLFRYVFQFALCLLI
mgnify:CR=1 FL=1